MVGKPIPHPEMGSETPDPATAATISDMANAIGGQITDAHGVIDRIEMRLNGPSPACKNEAMAGLGGIVDVLASAQRDAACLLKRLHELESRIGG